jgi:opacity protein-like surface antigen
MARAKSGFVLFLLLSVAAFAARAQDESFYVGASLGGATSGACNGIQVNVSCEDGVTSLKLFIGSQLTPNLALEAGFIPTLAKANAHAINNSTAATFASELSSSAVDVLLVPSFALGSNAFVYGKVGFYAAHTEQHNTTTTGPATCCVHISTTGQNPEQTNIGLTYGVGVGWSFTRQFSVRADWQRFLGVGGDNVREFDVDTLNLGLLYRF